eukprot:TRINITY_DN29458_c0_g1_i1.p1 TRINITY_DN29458_c0_g1~~TRINITY_DN29458_c0_g1_i1.p1  ORF type:complete len:813 (+),score=130.49 TRINITY_DN29458_c0_g1_i1:182-2440(+)
MAGPSALLILLASLLVARPTCSTYTSCMPGVYGSRCEGKCRCGRYEDCDDGISGDGSCSCALGYESYCGHGKDSGVVSPLRLPESLSRLVLANATLSALRRDLETWRRPRQVFNASVSRVLPSPWKAKELRLALFNPNVAALLGVAAPGAEDEAGFAEVFAGRRLLPGSQPFAHAYGGHQFGYWSGQLGDGRAISLGEASTGSVVSGISPLGGGSDDKGGSNGDDLNFPFEISLKGAGKTPYSRGGDGRAALANAAREFFAPVFLAACGIPVVGTLSVVASDAVDDMIVRDEWYDGYVARKKAGVVARVAPTLLRFGSLQLAAKRQGVEGLTGVVRFALAAMARTETRGDAAGKAYLDRLRAAGREPPPAIRERCFFGPMKLSTSSSCAPLHTSLEGPTLLGCFLSRVTEQTAALVAAWMSVGFAHGVMNTDNLSVLGMTLDLNVYGFLAKYDLRWSPNHIDDESRYAFGTQPEIAKWNLKRLADALSGTVFEEDSEKDSHSWARAEKAFGWLPKEDAASIIKLFDARFEECYAVRMGLRLGFDARSFDREGADKMSDPIDGTHRNVSMVVQQWLHWLEQSGADYPRASRGLAEVGDGPAADEAARLASHAGAGGTAFVKELAAFLDVFRSSHVSASSQAGNIEKSMPWRAPIRAVVPAYAPRSHILREAAKLVELEDGSGRPRLEALRHALEEPFDQSDIILEEHWDSIDDDYEEQTSEEALLTLAKRLRHRLAALPPSGMRQLQTSCGAQ